MSHAILLLIIECLPKINETPLRAFVSDWDALRIGGEGLLCETACEPVGEHQYILQPYRTSSNGAVQGLFLKNVV